MTCTSGLAFFILLLGILLFTGVPASVAGDSPPSPVPAVNTADGLGIKGYDPVAYFTQGRPTPGVDQYAYRWNGVTYRFAYLDNLERFKTNPDEYLPQYGGYCAYAMSLDRIADIDPSRWAIVDGKLYLNNGFISQSLWSLNKNGNIASGDRNWPQYPKTAIGR